MPEANTSPQGRGIFQMNKTIQRTDEFTESRLRDLLRRYLFLQNYKVPEKKDEPKIENNIFKDFEDYNSLFREVQAVKAHNDYAEKIRKKVHSAMSLVEYQIIGNLPLLNWFITDLNQRLFAVGISTSNWHGHQTTLQVLPYDPEETELPKLEHSTYN